MTLKSIRGILLILIIMICFNVFPKAQTTVQDSLLNKDKHIAYSSLPAWMVTNAMSTVTGSELQRSFTPNLSNTLYGRLSGLTVMQGGNEPGNDSPTLNIRGINTFGSGKSILIIVDGAESSFQQLVPDEIESISVLKDAAATSLYGSRGANGVLLVTTKRGHEGPMKVSFSTQQGFSQAQRLPDFLGSYDYARLYNEALQNNGQAARYSAADLEAYRTGSDPVFHPDVNWYNEILRKSAPTSNYNLNFNGGNSVVRYFVLLNALTNNGLYKKTADLSSNSINQNYSRYNFRSNIDVNLTKRLSAALILGGSVENKTSPVDINSSSMFNLLATIPPNAFPVRNPNNSFGGNSLYSNPFGDILNNGFYTSNSNTIQASLKMTEKLDFITNGLSLSGLVSFNSYYSGSSNKTRTYARYSLAQNALGDTTYNKIGQETTLVSNEGMLNQWRNTTVQAYLNYDRTFGIHKVNAMLMLNEESYSVAGTAIPFKYSGVGARFTYANHEKYIGEFSFAYNGSENFPKDKRWGLFPAVSLGWIASKENFLKANKILNYLKIRGSYGLTGNDAIGGTRFMFNAQPYVYGSGYTFGTTNTTQNTIVEGMIANPDVTWEKEKKLNFGFDATVLQRLDVSLDIFKNNRYDILAKPNRTIPQYLGFGTLPDYNVGKADNKGFEAMIRYNSDKMKDFQYFVETSVSYAKNKMVYSDEPFRADNYSYSTGHPIDQPFLLQAIGFFKDQADIDASPHQIFSTVQPGDLKYKDQNGDHIIDQNDYIAIGKSTLPEITVGLEAGFKFKEFDLNVFLQGAANRSVYLNGSYYQAFQNNGKISSIALGRWTPETAATATYPRLSAVNDLNNFQSSSFWQRDGSFIKLRSLELGYSLSTETVKKIHLNEARLFINGTNLFSLDHMDFTDPESLSGYPAVRTYSIGIRIQF